MGNDFQGSEHEFSGQIEKHSSKDLWTDIVKFFFYNLELWIHMIAWPSPQSNPWTPEQIYVNQNMHLVLQKAVKRIFLSFLVTKAQK